MVCLPALDGGCIGRALSLPPPHIPKCQLQTCARACRSRPGVVKANVHTRRHWRACANTEPGGRAERVLDTGAAGEKYTGEEEPQDDLWILNGLILVAGGLVPSLIYLHHLQEVLSWNHETRLVVVLAKDAVFAATTFAILFVGERNGNQRNPIYPRYPGPWVELSGYRRLPKHFNTYLVYAPALTGLLLPVLAVPAAAYGEHGWLGATVLVPYLFTLGVQIWSETWYNERGSPMWPTTPIVHMVYRFWQLARGGQLISELGGPAWLTYLLMYLAALWVFNFGAVMSWLPWMYRWHLQPDADRERVS